MRSTSPAGEESRTGQAASCEWSGPAQAQVWMAPVAGHGGVTGRQEPQMGGVIEHQMQVQA